MMNHLKRSLLSGLLLSSLALSGCELDLQDPNRPTEDEVFGDPEGVMAVAVGLQALYADEVRDPIWVNGLVADEIGAGRNAFQSYIDIDLGASITRGYYNTAAFDPWTGMYAVVKLANDLARVTPGAAGLTEGTKSGILATAKLYKAMALGSLVQLYETLPVDVGPGFPHPEFRDRQQVLTTVLQLLQEARSQIQTTPPSTVYLNQVRAPGLDLANTIDAMIARYSLIAGNYAQAIQAAQRVSPQAQSLLVYSTSDPNPLWDLFYNSGNAYQMRPEQAFRLQAETGDQRVAYWVRPASIPSGGAPLDDFNQFTTRTDTIAMYFPDEMKLIQAEAYARQNDLAQARTLINQVRTQCASPRDEPVACLPALSATALDTQAKVLAEILRQRRYELFLQGLRVEDLRRFGLPLKYPWMQIPQSECDRNDSAPC